MTERKRLPELLFDKSTRWWFSNIKDTSKNCGRVKHTWAKNKKEAKRIYRENIEKIVAEHAAQKPVLEPIDDAKSWSLVEMAARYYDLKKSDGCSPPFLAGIKRYLQRFLSWLKELGFNVCEKSAENLTSVLLADYRQSLADDTSIGIKTANHYIDHVRMLLLWASRMHGIHHPPIGSIRQFSKRKNAKAGHGRKQDRTPLSWKELEKLLSAADIIDTAILMLGLNCGFGNMDIGTLKMCDVDLKTGAISHPRSKTSVNRDFTLWPETINVLKLYLNKGRGEPHDEETAKRFFVGRKGKPLCWQKLNDKGKLKRSDAVKSRFVRLYKRAGLKRKYGIGFYILRHTYATFIGTKSNDFREVQAALGQITIQQQEAYRHDRKIKAFNAQKRLRDDMHQSSIPKILHDKLFDGEICENYSLSTNS